MSPPRFIVLEGPDGSGTTFHSRLLAERLAEEGREVLLTTEPSEGPVGYWIRQQLKNGSDLPSDALQLLFCADRAWHVHEIIQRALDQGKWVICDRYASSTVAYGEALGLDPAWLMNINEPFLKPDTLLFLLPSLEVSMERVGRREATDSFEERPLQEKVHRAYSRMAAENSSIQMIDSARDKKETAELIWEAVLRAGL